MIKLLPLLLLLGCFPDAKFVMQESLTEYQCEPELVAKICEDARVDGSNN